MLISVIILFIGLILVALVFKIFFKFKSKLKKYNNANLKLFEYFIGIISAIGFSINIVSLTISFIQLYKFSYFWQHNFIFLKSLLDYINEMFISSVIVATVITLIYYVLFVLRDKNSLSVCVKELKRYTNLYKQDIYKIKENIDSPYNFLETYKSNNTYLKKGINNLNEKIILKRKESKLKNRILIKGIIGGIIALLAFIPNIKSNIEYTYNSEHSGLVHISTKHNIYLYTTPNIIRVKKNSIFPVTKYLNHSKPIHMIITDKNGNFNMYYKKYPKCFHYVQIIHPIYLYKNKTFKYSNRIKSIPFNSRIRIKRVCKRDNITCIELPNKSYITSNHACLKLSK